MGKRQHPRFYSCNTATETQEWINSITKFLKPYKPLMDAHVVNFFKDRLWESVDKEWMDCLRQETLQNLLKLPAGQVQDYWPDSLKEFILGIRSLVLSREQQRHQDLQMILPDLHVDSINAVLAQGMNLKKKHEVEILAAITNSVAKSVGAQTIVDVGAGQGYLAQVLTFHYQLSVVAIDASSHHATVTSARAARIKKHYAAKMRESQTGAKELNMPQTVAIHVLSSEMLKAFNDSIVHEDIVEQKVGVKLGPSEPSFEGLQNLEAQSPSCNNHLETQFPLCNNHNLRSPLVLAGLHACGDLSATMLRTFVECEEVKAVISIGCCYNLLSEEGNGNASSHLGFPMSDGVNSTGFSLGKSARDLGCQSAERWRVLTEDAALQNFKLHAFRAAFQMVLHQYFPEVLARSPSIGRKGKALRRQQARKVQQNHRSSEANGKTCSIQCTNISSTEASSYITECKEIQYLDEYEDFCKSGLQRLGLLPYQGTDLLKLWTETEPFFEFIGPYWTLRACLGPLVETLLLLDRLLFLQEKGSSVKTLMLPVFDPVLSPRNMAIIAQKF